MRQMMQEFIAGYKAESAANTYTQAEVVMPIIREQDAAVFIHGMDWNTDGLDVIADNDDIHIQLTKQSKAARLNYDDLDALFIGRSLFKLVTSGMLEHKWQGNKLESKYPYIILEDKLYVGVGCTGQAGARTYYWRIYYTIEPITFKQMVRGSSRRL